MAISKIEKYNLQSIILPTFNECNRKLRDTAKLLSEKAGTDISYSAVKRYLDLTAPEAKEIPKVDVSEKPIEAVTRWRVDEKETIVEFYQEVIQTAMDVLRNAKTDKEKSFAVSTVMQTLNKALEHHGFGGKPSVQINNQFNTVVIGETKEKLLSVLRKYVNGSTEQVLIELQQVFDGN